MNAEFLFYLFLTPQNSDALVQQMWWWFVAPGACVALVGAGLSLVNFGIDELANPKLRNERPQKIRARPTSELPQESAGEQQEVVA